MTRDAILTLNAGSSSIKFALYPRARPLPERAVLSGQIDGLGARARLTAKDAEGRRVEDSELTLLSEESQHHAALHHLLSWIGERGQAWKVVGVGHRVVHGGSRYAAPVRLDAQAIDFLQTLVPLAPLHQPHNLGGVAAIGRLLPQVPQVACFDTAFHRTQPAVEQLFGLPRRLTEAGVRRYGFHGLSYEYIASVLPAKLGERAKGRVVVAHLGNGASMCAMAGLKSQGSTMGFTAVDGLMMGTRTGSLDPGVMIHLMECHGMDAAALTRLLYKESGLLGVSGISQDMRALLASAEPAAAEAVALFCHRILRELGALASLVGGLDALVFTGGIGEHAAPVRERICRGAEWMGIAFDPAANARDAERISAPGSTVDVLVIPTNEEWMIARHTEALLG